MVSIIWVHRYVEPKVKSKEISSTMTDLEVGSVPLGSSNDSLGEKYLCSQWEQFNGFITFLEIAPRVWLTYF